MTESIRIEHTFAVSEESFWKDLFLSEEYNRRMYVDALRFPVWRVVSEDDRGDHLLRAVEVEPPLGELPGPIAKVVGDGLRYREEGRYDKASHRYTVKVIPNRMADKMSVEGLLWTEAAGDKKVRRIFTATINVKIFGVGGMVEKRIAADLQRSYDAGARFTDKYIQEKGL